MNINYCLVNWAYEDEELLEPYEWQDEDPIEWLFQIPLCHVSSLFIQDCLESIITFKDLKQGYYIVSDGKTSLALAIDANGHLCMRSALPYELRGTILRLVNTLPLVDYIYDISDFSQPKAYGLTRFEKEKKQLLLSYLDLFDHEEISELAFHDMNYIENGYHLFHEYLYMQIVKQNKRA